MPEDDYDLYGEEDGYRRQQHQREEDVRPPKHEPVDTMISAVEPNVGDKRLRDDDHDRNPAPASRQSASGGHAQQQDIPVQGVSQNQMASSNYGGGGAMAVNQQAMAGQMMNGGGMGMGYDALYIGDLQWVRLSCRLVSCHSEVISQCAVYPFKKKKKKPRVSL